MSVEISSNTHRSPSEMCSLVSSMSGSSTSSAVVASSSNTSCESDTAESTNQLPLLIVLANLNVLGGERLLAVVSPDGKLARSIFSRNSWASEAPARSAVESEKEREREREGAGCRGVNG